MNDRKMVNYIATAFIFKLLPDFFCKTGLELENIIEGAVISKV